MVIASVAFVQRSTIIILFGALFLFVSQAMAQTAAPKQPFQAPRACFFFEPDPAFRPEKQVTANERRYIASFVEVYKTWCTPSHATPEVKAKAVNAMVSAWKLLWDQDPPYDVEFHETGASDLLELMGLTHELPAQMVQDSQLLETWIAACRDSCFTIWSVPENRKEEHGVGMQLWLRNDVLNSLRKESGAEPVIKMLEDAQFRLVD